MKLTDSDIKEFQIIIKEDYGVDIGWNEASENAHKIVQLMEIVLEVDDLKEGDK